MLTQHPTRRLIQTLGLGWLSFLGLGLALRHTQQLPTVAVVINQSYCPPAQWQQQVVQPYADLYQQVQSKQLEITQIVVVTDIDQITLPNIPAPEALGKPFGQAPDPAAITAAQATHPESVVLQCTSP